MKITALVQKDSGLTIAQFDPKELLNSLNNVKLAFVPNQDIDSLIRENTERHLERATISPNGVVYPVYHDRMIEVQDPPQPSGSPNSAARYYIWDNETGLLLQFIPPYSRTSCNYHKRTDEHFYNLGGECFICLPEGEKTLSEAYHVIPFQCHRLYTASVPAINMILMNPSGLGMSDHCYPEKCVRELW